MSQAFGQALAGYGKRFGASFTIMPLYVLQRLCLSTIFNEAPGATTRLARATA